MRIKLTLVVAFFVFQFSFANTKAFMVPILPNIPPLTYCDSNNDGFGVFDLTDVSPIILAAQSGVSSDYTISYHETMADAASGNNPITAPYSNINPFTQTVYYLIVQISSGDAAIGSFTLIVNPRPIATTPNYYHLCDVSGAVGYEAFNLNTVVPEVLGSIDPSTVSVSFYTSQSAAENGVSAIINTSNYINALWNQTIYVRLETISTGCYHVVPLHLVVDPIPQSIQPNYPEYVLCDTNAPIGYEAFDLSSRIPSILLGQTGMDVTFFVSLLDAQNGTNQIANPSSFMNTVIYVQTLGIRITNQVTGCYVISTMDIRVEPLPNLVPPSAPYTICDDNQDGFGSFDLTSLIPGLLNGGSYVITFHETLNDAETDGTSIPLPSSYSIINPFTQTIYVRGEDSLTGCYMVLPIVLQINSAPIVDSLAAIQVCDADANPQNGVTSVNLTQQTAAILALQPSSASNYTVSFYTNQVLAESGSAPIINDASYIGSNGDTIWYRVENNSSGCFNVGSFQLAVNSVPFATGPQFFADCDNYSNPYDGVGIIDLTQFAPSILNGQNPATHQIKYFATQADAISGTNQILLSSTQSYQTPSTTIWVKVINSSGCYSLTTIGINITASPNPIINTIDNRNTICVDFITNTVVQPLTLNSGIGNSSAYTFIWRENGGIIAGATNSTYTVNNASVGGASRSYTVKVTSNNALGCYTTSSSFLVLQSGQAVVSFGTNGYTIANLSGVQSITVDIIGYGIYEYSLDNGPQQTSNVFENVSLGTHSISVWDTEGNCDPLIISEVLIDDSLIPAPTGLISQTFPSGSTLADIVVNGSDVQWYASANNKNQNYTFSTPLPLNTVLVDGTTYYATQTVGGTESTAYLPVTVHLTLGVGDNEVLPIRYAPNPVKNNLTLQSPVVIKSVSVYTILGQKVFEQNYNDTNISIDLSRLAAGNYILKAQGETGQKTLRIIKE